MVVTNFAVVTPLAVTELVANNSIFQNWSLWNFVEKKITFEKINENSGFVWMFINWIIGVILVYSILFGTGKLILGDLKEFFIYLAIAVISIFIVYLILIKIGWKKVIE